MATLDFELSYAGIPFLNDTAKVVQLSSKTRAGMNPAEQPPAKHQVEMDLVDELNRLLPFRYLADCVPPSTFPGKGLSQIARQKEASPHPTEQVQIGEYYYPTGASRWSIFRGLATTTMVKEMMKKAYVGGTSTAQTFRMKCVPDVPGGVTPADYDLQTSLFLLPPRPLAEHGTAYDGLYLVTLVDERWYWQYRGVNLKPQAGPAGRTSWKDLLDLVKDELSISFAVSAAAVYLDPEPDSQLFGSQENATILLDALAFNIGRQFVRKLDGTYVLESNSNSATIVDSNRGAANTVIRSAGGGLYDIAIGAITSKNAILPANIAVSFPIYIEPTNAGTSAGDTVDTANPALSPVPYLFNSRFRNKRPSAWTEDSFSDSYTKSVILSSAGSDYTGITGKGKLYLRTTAKAIYDSEASADPRNKTELDALALQLAKDHWNFLSKAALDESYPGIYAWEPEGYHDIIWTWSTRRRLASTRVVRSPWNQCVKDFQHSASLMPRGVGGHPVAQTIRDCFSGTVSANVFGLNSGSMLASFDKVANFPTQNRWKGIASGGLGTEIILFDGTSGETSVSIAMRGIDGTEMKDWAGLVPVQQLEPNVTYGVNLISYEKMEFVYPSEWTSGGIQGIRKVPQIQTVYAYSASGELVGSSGNAEGVWHYSGRVRSFDETRVAFPNQELVWLIERNSSGITSGKMYDGQLAGYSYHQGASGVNMGVSPIYLINETGGGGGLPLRFAGGLGPSPLSVGGNADLGSVLPDIYDDQYTTFLTESLSDNAGTIKVLGRGLFPKTFPFQVRVNNLEDMEVSAIDEAGTTWTVTRGINGTDPLVHFAAAYVVLIEPITTTLATTIDDEDISLTTEDSGDGTAGRGFPTDGRFLCSIDNELILVLRGGGTTTWVIGRGINGTAKVQHNAGAKIIYLAPGMGRYRDLMHVGYTFVQPGRFPGEAFITEPAQLYREDTAIPKDNDGFFTAYLRRWHPVRKTVEDTEKIWLWKPGISDTDSDETCLARMVGWAKGRKVFMPDCCCATPIKGNPYGTELKTSITSTSTSITVPDEYLATTEEPVNDYNIKIGTCTTSEVAKVTGRQINPTGGTNLTITRAQQGTTAIDHPAGSPVAIMDSVRGQVIGSLSDTGTMLSIGALAANPNLRFPTRPQFVVEIGEEKLLVTEILTSSTSSATWTVERSHQDSTAAIHNDGDIVRLQLPQINPSPTALIYQGELNVSQVNGASIIKDPVQVLELIEAPDANGFSIAYKLRFNPFTNAMERGEICQALDLNFAIDT